MTKAIAVSTVRGYRSESRTGRARVDLTRGQSAGQACRRTALKERRSMLSIPAKRSAGSGALLPAAQPKATRSSQKSRKWASPTTSMPPPLRDRRR
jgi:hypothetical protein